MAHDARGQPDDPHPQAPWWWGVGPVGAVVLLGAGITGALWLFPGSPQGADNPAAGYQAGKVVSIGLVLVGTVVLERLRSRTQRADGAEDRENG